MRANVSAVVFALVMSLFITVTIVFLVVIAVLMVIQPRFPFDLGILRTVGRSGLWLTILPAAVAVLGLVQFRRRRPVGAVLLAAYSSFWALVFLAGLPRIWNANQSFCLKGLNFCIISPWVARLTVLAIVAPFVCAAWWSVRESLNLRIKSPAAYAPGD